MVFAAQDIAQQLAGALIADKNPAVRRRGIVLDGAVDTRRVLLHIRVAEEQCVGVQLAVFHKIPERAESAALRCDRWIFPIVGRRQYLSDAFGMQPRMHDAEIAQQSEHADTGHDAGQHLRHSAGRAAQRLFEIPIGEESERARRDHRSDAIGRRQQSAAGNSVENQNRPMPQIEWVANQAHPDHGLAGQYLPVEPGIRAGRDRQEGAAGRQYRPEAGKYALGVQFNRTGGDQKDSANRARVRMAPQDSRPVHDDVGERAADHELPKSRQRRVKGRHRTDVNGRDVDCERDRSNHKRDDEEATPALPDQAQHQRPSQVELLFDAERPEVQQRFRLGRGIEVSGFVPQHQVRDKPGAARHVLAEQLEFVRQQHVPTRQQRRSADRRHCRKYSPDPPRIKIDIAEASVFETLENDGADQKSRDDEKDVDPDKSAFEDVGEGVKANDATDRYCAQTVDIWPIFYATHFRAVASPKW